MADKMIDGKTASEWFKLGYKAEDSLRKLEYYGYTTELDPKNGNAWNNRGWALSELKRYEEAIQDLSGKQYVEKHKIDIFVDAKENTDNAIIINGPVHSDVLGNHATKATDNVVMQKGHVTPESVKPFSVCPHCGEQLNFSRTPKFCPYCSEKLVT